MLTEKIDTVLCWAADLCLASFLLEYTCAAYASRASAAERRVTEQRSPVLQDLVGLVLAGASGVMFLPLAVSRGNQSRRRKRGNV